MKHYYIVAILVLLAVTAIRPVEANPAPPTKCPFPTSFTAYAREIWILNPGEPNNGRYYFNITDTAVNFRHDMHHDVVHANHDNQTFKTVFYHLNLETLVATIHQWIPPFNGSAGSCTMRTKSPGHPHSHDREWYYWTLKGWGNATFQRTGRIGNQPIEVWKSSEVPEGISNGPGLNDTATTGYYTFTPYPDCQLIEREAVGTKPPHIAMEIDSLTDYEPSVPANIYDLPAVCNDNKK